MELLTMRRTVARLLPVVLLAASAAAAHAQVESETTNSIFLRGTGATPNPATLFLDIGGPTATVPKMKDATALRFAGGNAWKEIGTWEAKPFEIADLRTFITDLGTLHVWLGLLNSDDQGTKFDVKGRAVQGQLSPRGRVHDLLDRRGHAAVHQRTRA